MLCRVKEIQDAMAKMPGLIAQHRVGGRSRNTDFATLLGR